MLSLKVQKRNIIGKKSKKLLKEGYIPGVLYGPKIESVSVQVLYKDFEKVYKDAGKTTLISIAGKESLTKSADDNTDKNIVLIRDVKINAVSQKFIHVDFYQLPLDKEIEIMVPINSSGEAPAVKQLGGILVHNLHEVNVKALPTNLINEIAVDLLRLENIGDSILIKDLVIDDNIEVLADIETVVFTVEAPREEEPEEKEETGEEEDQIADIKTEGEEKREEDEDVDEGDKKAGAREVEQKESGQKEKAEEKE